MGDFVEIKSAYKEKILHIWKKYEGLSIFDDEAFYYRKYPIAPEKISKYNLLFIGINPSFAKGSELTKEEVEQNISFYSNNHSREDDIPYFKKIKEVANYCGSDWTHLDLFFLRETNQKVIERLSYSSDGIKFLSEQLDITFEIIEQSAPKLIVVSNAFASEFFGKRKNKHHSFKKIWKGYPLFFEEEIIKDEVFQSTFNNNIGTYEVNINNKKVPIIFCGMLSGQRALDIGSLERLKWQIKFILEKKKLSD